jgi:hypothetical protein
MVHVGGDAVVGLPHPEVIKLFQQDPDTKAIVMFGEIGGSQEERVADLIESGEVTKPVIAYIGGKAAKSGTRFSHAGAIIEGGRGTYQGKVDRLRSVGAKVVDAFGDLPAATKEVRSWLRAHNRDVRRTGQGVRIVACYLPIKSPWLNRIEPHWVHGKRKVVEPAGLLSAQELANRICAHFGCDHEPHLIVTEKAA